jgi:hypothetical protein
MAIKIQHGADGKEIDAQPRRIYAIPEEQH